MIRCWYIAIFCVFSLLLSTPLFAKGIVLNAHEVDQLLVGNTITVTEAKSDKKTGKKDTFRAYISDGGVVRTSHASGAARSYSWSIREDGSFCFKNNMRRRRGGSCGFFYRDSKGSYGLYRVKGEKSKKGRVVAVNKAKLLLTVISIKKGNHLK